MDKLVTLAQRAKSSGQQVKEMTASHVKATDAISENKPKEFLCGRCGHKHNPRECPAYGQQCSACHKLHHFAKMCHNNRFTNANKNSKSSIANASISRKKAHTVCKGDTSSDTDSEPQVFMHAVQVHGITGSSWLSTVHTEGGKITFKLDTGAEASVLPKKVYKKLKCQPMIDSIDTMLSAYGGFVINASRWVLAILYAEAKLAHQLSGFMSFPLLPSQF